MGAKAPEEHNQGAAYTNGLSAAHKACHYFLI